jgi:hypothetical protein
MNPRSSPRAPRRLALLLLLAPLPFAVAVPISADAESALVWGSYVHGEDPSVFAKSLAPIGDGVVMSLGYMGDAASGHPALVYFDAGGREQHRVSYGDTPVLGSATTLASAPALGLVYLVGDTTQDSGIATPDAEQPTRACFSPGLCGRSGFVAQFDARGELQWGTYFGGPYNETIADASADPSGALYVCGTTESPTEIATPGSHQPHRRGDQRSGFVAKFERDGSLQWATYYDGPCLAVAADPTGDGVVIGGWAVEGGEYVTRGAHQRERVSSNDAYLARFDADGVRQWGSFFGEGRVLLHELAVDPSGSFYAVATTEATTMDVSRRAHQDRYGGGSSDLYIARFESNGERQWATYFGGESHDVQPRAAVDRDGNLIFAATTYSRRLATSGGPSSSIGEQADVILGQFRRDGALAWAVYYGGELSEHVGALAIDEQGRIYLGGHTQSETGIATPGAHQTEPGDYRTGFLAMFRSRW